MGNWSCVHARSHCLKMIVPRGRWTQGIPEHNPFVLVVSTICVGSARNPRLHSDPELAILITVTSMRSAFTAAMSGNSSVKGCRVEQDPKALAHGTGKELSCCSSLQKVGRQPHHRATVSTIFNSDVMTTVLFYR